MLTLLTRSYDADEPAASAPPPKQSIPAPEPVEATAPISTDHPPDTIQQDGNNNGSANMAGFTQNDHTSNHDDRDESRWDHGGRGSRMDVAAEQDSGGIGIKEDG